MARNKANIQNIDGSDLQNYPDKRIKDNSGSGDGTPVNEFIYGDIHEFFAKAMRLYGIVHNGNPDNETNGYQLISAIVALASKNDFIVSLNQGNSTTFTATIKASKIKNGEVFMALCNFNKTSETKITGTLDIGGAAFNVFFEGGDFKIGEYVKLIKTTAGFTVVRELGVSNFLSIANDFEIFESATILEEVAGLTDEKSTTPLSNMMAFIERVNGASSNSFLATQLINGLLSKEDKLKIDNLENNNKYGSFLLGNIAQYSIGTTFPVVGQLQSATLTEVFVGGGDASNIVTVTLNSSMPNSNYNVHISVESLGSINTDASIYSPVWKKVNNSQFRVVIKEFAPVDQDLRIHVEAIAR